MDLFFLSRLQFALTIAFHYIFPPITIGLGVVLVVMEGLYLKTGHDIYKTMTKFWVKVFALVFAIGVATGIVMEFQFGTNWSAYSRFVGDVFGSALAAEGIFAFFLESGFLAILLFGWDRVPKGFHFAANVLVALGAHFSAVWIVIANSWMHTPAGHHIVGEGLERRAEIVDFWAMVFNPSSVSRVLHVYAGCWQAGAWFVASVSAYYLLKNRHRDFARRSLKIALGFALFASLFQLGTGDWSAKVAAKHQPAKLAAVEAHYEASAPADMYLFGWVDEKNETVRYGVKVPGFLSWLLHGDRTAPVTGLRAFSPEDRPPVNIVFQTYHAMVAIGIALIVLALWSVTALARGTIEKSRFLLSLLVASVLGPQLANQLGWMTAEIGRQPWIVYNLMRTSEGVSKSVRAEHVIGSIVMFGFVYLLLFALFIFLLDQKIKHGPEEGIHPAGRADL